MSSNRFRFSSAVSWGLRFGGSVFLIPQYFATPQPVGDLLLSVEPYVLQIEIKGNTVQVAATYKPLAPVVKD